MNITSTKRWLFSPAKHRKRQVKSIKAQGDGYEDEAAHHLWFHVLGGSP